MSDVTGYNGTYIIFIYKIQIIFNRVIMYIITQSYYSILVALFTLE